MAGSPESRIHIFGKELDPEVVGTGGFGGYLGRKYSLSGYSGDYCWAWLNDL